MRILDIRQQSLSFTGRNREFAMFLWFLIFLACFAFIAYLFFIHASVYDVVRTQKTNDEISNLRADLTTIEQEYFSLSRRLTFSVASANGLVSISKNKVHFVLPETGEKTAQVSGQMR